MLEGGFFDDCFIWALQAYKIRACAEKAGWHGPKNTGSKRLPAAACK
jgi:hypothetical protein